MANKFVLPGEGLRIFPGAATSACSTVEQVDAAADLVCGWKRIVKHVRIRIKPIRPDDGPGLVIDTHLLKVLRVAKGITQRSTEQWRQVNITDEAVIEGETEIVTVKRLDCCYPECHCKHVREAGRSRQVAAWLGQDPNRLPAPPCAAQPIL